MKKTIIRISTLIALSLLIEGCSTPQERRGVSPIPFNSPNPEDTGSTINGNF